MIAENEPESERVCSTSGAKNQFSARINVVTEEVVAVIVTASGRSRAALISPDDLLAHAVEEQADDVASEDHDQLARRDTVPGKIVLPTEFANVISG